MLAIVIPFYKLTFFEATLKSLANQTDKRFKVYIGDDASSESLIDVLDKYNTTVDFAYKRFETNLGGVSLMKQWERCIDMLAEEEWIMIFGDDDVLEDNCVAAFYENLNEIEELKINVIRFATKVINSFGEPISKIHLHPKLENSIDFLMRKFKGGTRSSLSEYIFRKHIVYTIKFKDLPLAWFSDLLAVLEFSKFGLIYSINEAVVHFRLSQINITGKNDDLLLKNVATFNFYHYLLKQHKAQFKLNEQEEILIRLENTFLDNKKNPYFWFQLIKLYVANFYFRRYFLLIVKSIQSVLKRNK